MLYLVTKTKLSDHRLIKKNFHKTRRVDRFALNIRFLIGYSVVYKKMSHSRFLISEPKILTPNFLADSKIVKNLQLNPVAF